MFEKEIDEIYELCKRVVNEVPTVSVEFSYSIYGMRVCGLKRKEDAFSNCILFYFFIQYRGLASIQPYI